LKKVLFVSYGGGHVNALAPVYAELLKSKEIDCTYLACTTAANSLKNANLKHTTYSALINELYNLKEQTEILEYGNELASKINGHAIPIEETIAYLGVSFYELAQKHGLDKAKELYKSEGRKVFLTVDFAKRLCRLFKPDLIVTTSSPRTERSFVYAAKEMKIECYCLLDLYDEDFISKYLSKNDYADKIFIFKELKNKMISFGRNESDFILSGNPAFDYLHSISKKDIASFKARLPDPSKPCISFIKSQNGIFDEIEDKILEKLIEANKCKSFNLIVRQHPNDVEQISSNKDYLVCNKVPLNSLIGGTELFITVISTVGFEASIIGKEVIQVLEEGLVPATHFEELGYGKTVYIENDLANTVQNCLIKIKDELYESNSKVQIKTSTELVVESIKNALV